MQKLQQIREQRTSVRTVASEVYRNVFQVL